MTLYRASLLIAQEPFYMQYWFMGLMAVLLIALIIVFFYLRNQREEDD
jgi:hypothetical protein